MVLAESPGAGAGADSARSGGCNGIRLGEAGVEAVRRALESARLAGDGWATWGRAGPDLGPG